MMLSDVCQSVCLSVGPKSRTERPRKTKIGTDVAYVTRDSDTTFKVKGQRSRSPGRFTHRGVYASGSYSGDRGNVFTVGTYCSVAVRRGRLSGGRRFGAHRVKRGARAYCGGSRTACSKCHFAAEPFRRQIQLQQTAVFTASPISCEVHSFIRQSKALRSK